MFRMKSVVGAITLATMIGSTAFAAPAEAPLAPGKPAGVHEADLGIGHGTLIIGLLAVAVLATVAITTSQTPGDRTGSNQTFSPATTAP